MHMIDSLIIFLFVNLFFFFSINEEMGGREEFF